MMIFGVSGWNNPQAARKRLETMPFQISTLRKPNHFSIRLATVRMNIAPIEEAQVIRPDWNGV